MRRTQPSLGGGLPPLSVRISDACRMTGIGRSKFYELIKDGAVEAIKVGAITLVPMSSIQALLDRGHRGAAASTSPATVEPVHPFVIKAVLTSSLAGTSDAARIDLCSRDQTIRTNAEDGIVARMVAAICAPGFDQP